MEEESHAGGAKAWHIMESINNVSLNKEASSFSQERSGVAIEKEIMMHALSLINKEAWDMPKRIHAGNVGM